MSYLPFLLGELGLLTPLLTRYTEAASKAPSANAAIVADNADKIPDMAISF